LLPKKGVQVGNGLNRLEVFQECRLPCPPALLPLEIDRLLGLLSLFNVSQRLAHEHGLLDDPDLEALKVQEDQEGIVVIVVRLQMLPDTVVFAGPVACRFDLNLLLLTGSIILGGGARPQLK